MQSCQEVGPIVLGANRELLSPLGFLHKQHSVSLQIYLVLLPVSLRKRIYVLNNKKGRERKFILVVYKMV